MESGSRVAVLGAGIMGGPMAGNLARAGFDVVLWNRTRAKAEAIDGVTVGTDPAATVEGAEAVITMLSDGDAVAGTMLDGGGLDAMSEGSVWVQMSTIGLDATERLAKEAESRGVAFVDAPVLGSKQPAESGELTVLASGPDDALDRLADVFDAVGKKTVLLGDVGDGSRLKLVVNSWIVSLVEVISETIGFAQAIGLDPRTFLKTIDGQHMGTPYAQVKGKLMLERNFPVNFPLKWALKDARLVSEAARANGLDLPVTQAVIDQFAKAVDLGFGDDDFSAAYEAVAQSLDG